MIADDEGEPRESTGAPLRLNVIHRRHGVHTGSERIDFHAPYLCAPESHRRAGEDGADRRRRAVGAVERGARATWTSARGDVPRSGAWPRRHDGGGGGGGGPSPSVSADSHGLGFLARTQATRGYPSDALNTRTALTLYLLIVSVITARTVALTLIKVQLNKTKTENNHFCLTGKMARYVAEAVTTHAPLAKHMFFRPELCAGLMHRGCRCCAARPPGEAPPELERDKRRVRTGCG